MLKPISKKGQVQSIAPAVLALVFAAVILVFGLVINQALIDTQISGAAGCNSSDTNDCGPAYDAGNKTLVGLGTFADFWEIIVLAIVITVVIGLLLVVFGGRRSR